MKRTFLALLLLLATVVAHAAKFTTDRFMTAVNMAPDGGITIHEHIEVRFTEPQRGLIRKIPFRTKAATGEVRTVQYTLVDVYQDAGQGRVPANVKESEEGGDWQLRIGRADQFLSGAVKYDIRYRVEGAWTPIEKNDQLGPRAEFLWNVTPTNWPTRIDNAFVRFTFPPVASGEAVARILVGPRGTRKGVQLGQKTPIVGDTRLVQAKFDGNDLSIVPLRPLAEGESVTVDLALPKGTVIVTPPDIVRYGDNSGPSLPDLPSLPWLGFAPLISLPVVFLLARRGWAPADKPLVVRFDPPTNCESAMAGLLYDDRADQRDIVSGIVSLAQKGAFKLHHAGDGVQGVVIEVLPFERARGYTNWEAQLYAHLAPYGPIIAPDMLRGTFGQSYNSLVSSLHGEAFARGFMKDVGGSKGGVGCLLIGVTGLATLVGFVFNPCVAILCGAVALFGGFAMLGRITPLTELGLTRRWEARGLYEFISRAHRKELNYMVERMPDQALFETILPYAVAFNLVKQWTQAFEGIDLQMPDWYDTGGMGYGNFWTGMLIADLLDFDHSYGSAVSYSPPTTSFDSGGGFSSGDSGFGGSWDSGGGGFDGGFSGGDGGGGGGGDSW